MRIFIAVLILIFSLQSWTKADKIQDFEIEGMSIGDSLLDFLDKNEIQKNYSKGTSSTTFVSSYNIMSSELYDGIQFHYKSLDKKFILHGISGIAEYSNNNIEKCYDKISVIFSELENMFPTAKIDEEIFYNHPIDKKGESKILESRFILNDGGQIKIACTMWSERMQSKHNWFSHLRIAVVSDELLEWLAKIYNN